MLWLITATNADGSFRQWAEKTGWHDPGDDGFVAMEARHSDPHRCNPGNGNLTHAFPAYTAQPL